MNIKLHRKFFFQRAWVVTVLLAGIFLVPSLHAQSAERTVQGRFLFIFDTSWAMRNRVDAVQKAVNATLATSLNGQLHSGDSIGVWTFNQDLAAGNYPLQTWDADHAVTIASNLVKFIGGQHYAKTSRFEALQPLLNQVVQGSERLTVLVFCDGTVPASGTPFDAGINQVFHQKLDEQSKAHQPFIISLRSQLGKFTGCAVSFPPAPLNLPEFPPLPAPPPPPPAPKVTNPPPPVVTSVVPSLFITGTKVSTNQPPPENNSPPTNAPAPPPVTALPTNAPIQPANPPAAPPTNQALIKIIEPAATNAPARTQEISDASGKKPWVIGTSLLGAVAVLGIIVRLRSHRRETSLITRSMNDRR
jgi:hypothetical protein